MVLADDIDGHSRAGGPEPCRESLGHLPRILLALCCLGWLGLVGQVGESPTWLQGELGLSRPFHALRQPWLTPLVEAFSWLGSTQALTLLTTLVVMAPLWARGWRERVLFLVNSLLASAINLGLKQLFARPRPGADFSPLVSEPYFSFPSGHVTLSLAIYGFSAYLIGHHWPQQRRRVWLVLVVGLSLMGLTRIYLGAHYPGDILGGLAAGTLQLALMVRLHARVSERTRLAGSFKDL